MLAACRRAARARARNDGGDRGAGDGARRGARTRRPRASPPPYSSAWTSTGRCRRRRLGARRAARLPCLAPTLFVRGCCPHCGTRARRCLRRARRWCRARSRCMPVWSRARRSRLSVACGKTRRTSSTCASERAGARLARVAPIGAAALTAHRRGGGAEVRARRRGAAGEAGEATTELVVRRGGVAHTVVSWWEADLGGGATVSTAPGAGGLMRGHSWGNWPSSSRPAESASTPEPPTCSALATPTKGSRLISVVIPTLYS